MCWLLAMVALAVVYPVLQGYVLACSWGWFISGPLGVRELSLGSAIGIAFTASLVVPPYVYVGSRNDSTVVPPDAFKVLGYWIGTGIVFPLLMLGIGRLLHLFV